MKPLAELRLLLVSGNDIPVDRVSLPASEFETLLNEIETLRSDRDHQRMQRLLDNEADTAARVLLKATIREYEAALREFGVWGCAKRHEIEVKE